MMERWNDGILGHKKGERSFLIGCVPSAKHDAIPSFHYSNCERSELNAVFNRQSIINIQS
jgi:hypothetical protein